uniref:Uncharacterized protein n=1 Tax=Anopheles epiroticus TaxID=199890 RepID=A0A182PHI3_9DIPT
MMFPLTGCEEAGIRRTERDRRVHELCGRYEPLHTLGEQWLCNRDVLRASAQKGAAPSDTRREDDRRDRAHHLPVGVRCLFDIFLHPLQGILLEYDPEVTHPQDLHQQPAVTVGVHGAKRARAKRCGPFLRRTAVCWHAEYV